MSSAASEADRFKAFIEEQGVIHSSCPEPDALRFRILESVIHLIDCESVLLFLAMFGTDSVCLAAAVGFDAESMGDGPVDAVAKWVCKNRRSLMLNGSGKIAGFDAEGGFSFKTALAVPLCASGECTGAIVLLNSRKRAAFTAQDLRLLEMLSIQAGIAWRNAERFRAVQNEARLLSVNAGSAYRTFIAESPAMLDLISMAEKISKNDPPVLISGEDGTGKELFAEQLHLRSGRADKPFIRVDCAASSAFDMSGIDGCFFADSDTASRFEDSGGGTLFLDEVARLSPAVQKKLLAAIQDGGYLPAGVRIIAATSRNLEMLVDSGAFLSELYYRLNVLPIRIPPLRQRKEDIEPLACFFCRKFSLETNKAFSGFSIGASKALTGYYWPGNVRELKNAVERACILGRPPLIQAADLRLNTAVRHDELAAMHGAVFAQAESSADKTLKNAVRLFKRAYIMRILEETAGNQTAAGRILGIQRTYLSRLLNELNIR